MHTFKKAVKYVFLFYFFNDPRLRVTHVPFSRAKSDPTRIEITQKLRESGKLSCFNFNHNLLTNW